MMRLSIIIRTKDEADRLRLTLTSLAGQSARTEIIVVNDGSSDHTASVIADAAVQYPLKVIHHAAPRGRGGASNAGVRIAQGDVVVFLDGDTLANPDLAVRHLAVHSTGDGLIGRGETYHFRGTRFLLDPEAGTPRPGEEARVARLTRAELDRLRVTRCEITDDFAGLAARAAPGIYPGAGPRRLYELEMDALHHHPDCAVLWAAACGSNLSVRRDAFLRTGGFDEALDKNEHRELALRLYKAGARMVPVGGARTYHLTHRAGWRDPLYESAWEEVFYRAHPILAVKLLSIFWAGLSGKAPDPDLPRLGSLPELAAAARGGDGVDYDTARRRIGALPDLSSVIGAERLVGASA